MQTPVGSSLIVAWASLLSPSPSHSDFLVTCFPPWSQEHFHLLRACVSCTISVLNSGKYLEIPAIWHPNCFSLTPSDTWMCPPQKPL